MDVKVKRKFKSGIQKLFDLFSIQFKYATPQDKSYDDDLGTETNRSYSDYTEINEPLFPNSSSNSNQILSSNGGTTEQYSYIWLSNLNVPNKTKIDYHGTKLIVIDRADYQELAGIYEYYLKGQGDLND